MSNAILKRRVGVVTAALGITAGRTARAVTRSSEIHVPQTIEGAFAQGARRSDDAMEIKTPALTAR